MKSDDEVNAPADGPADSQPTNIVKNVDPDATIGVSRDESSTTNSTQVIGGYHLIKELGAGGQGAVYLAEDLKLKRQVALKVLSGGANLSGQARMRFEREAETTSRLNHPGIAKVFDLGEDNGILFIAMELVEGQTLESRISESKDLARQHKSISELQTSTSNFSQSSSKSNPSSAPGNDERPFLAAIRFMEDTALALHSAHEAGLIHRDIKPANIMMRPNGSSCILDFGLVHDNESQEMTLTQTGDVFGTPAYMAPEQVQGQISKIDARTDVWGLGAALYECCTLKRPFKGSTRHDLFQSIIQDEPLAPSRINRKIPKDLDAIILTAIDKDPERRYATALEFAEDLRRLREYEAIHARPAGRWVKTVRWAQRNRVVAVSGILVFLSMLVAAGVFYVKGEEAKDSRDDALVAQNDAETARDEAQTARDLAKSESEQKSIALEREREALKVRTQALAAEKAEREKKELALANYDRLADVKRLEKATAQSDLLYPPSPELVAKLIAWQKQHSSLTEKLAGHREFLKTLRTQALPYSDADRSRDFAKEIATKKRVEESLAKLAKDVAAAKDDAAKKKLRAQKKNFTEQEEKLTMAIAGRRTWDFGDESALSLQHDIMAQLVNDISAFAEGKQGAVASIAKRLTQSKEIAAKSIEQHKDAWTQCRERIKKSKHYTDLELKPQLGLIPLGPDPKSGLEEFLHFLTHKSETPVRDTDGKITVTEDLGIILVLIPGGTFKMGSQKEDPKKANYDPGAAGGEGPVHEVKLEAYFLSKYEMTQAQWQRSFAANPSRYPSGFSNAAFNAPITPMNPVEQVSWLDVQKFLPRIDLILPTEAEWERAARANRKYLVFSGTSKVGELKDFANIKGSETKAVGFIGQEPGHTDDHVLHAPVGSYQANAFGLHDITGNVWEWCFDGFVGYGTQTGDRGKRGEAESSAVRVLRGGGFIDPAAQCRVTIRNTSTPGLRDATLGTRPSRIVTY
ncbi:MAG: serine/threonine protein kinase/formylglycine-generating enzyme required for sulfatase activity [Planctomycetota bacterium]|jgi:serine/threonine protein kinase/formylglycine-generating enzyme required for sulfatase activity